MKHTEADGLLEEACQRGTLGQILEEYIALCHSPCEEAHAGEKKSKASVATVRFPNLAGFCRFLGCSTEEWLTMEKEHPEVFGRLRAALEDEALNVVMSPTVVTAYLKKRLGYDKDQESDDGPITLCFAHNVLDDGE